MLYRKLDVLWPSGYVRLSIILKLLKLAPKYAHIEFIAYSVCLQKLVQKIEHFKQETAAFQLPVPCHKYEHISSIFSLSKKWCSSSSFK